MWLRDSGRKEEALRLLNELQEKGIAYPTAMGVQANLMRDLGELEGARMLLESLKQMAPEDPAVLFNLAGLWLQLNNAGKAREYADRIDPRGTSPEFRRMLAGLKEHINRIADFTELPDVDAISDAYREEAEEKPISPGITLAAALKEPGRVGTALAEEAPEVWAALRLVQAPGADPEVRPAGWRRLLLG
jgi:thioredoxin-like negative regulator of GroEL